MIKTKNEDVLSDDDNNYPPYYLLNSGDNFPILSINDTNVIIDLLSKSPKQESIEIYNTNPIIHNMVKIIHNLALNKNLFTDRRDYEEHK
jgi:hypothetical protein